MRQRTRARAAGFTLIELLVVIGIIAVLVALVMPAVFRARETGKSVKCASNLRQLGAGLVRYTTETGYYPGWGTSDQMIVFAPRISAMIGGNRSAFLCPGAPPEFDWPQNPDASFSSVKATAEDVGYGYKEGEPVLIDRTTPMSYGYNAWAGGISPARGLGLWVDKVPEVRASRVKVPANLIALTDGNSLGGTQVIGASDLGVGGDVDEFHLRGSNTLYCDGHVEWDRLEDISFSSLNRKDPRRRKWTIDHQL